MDKYIGTFKSLSDRTRIRIIQLLLKAKCELCICEIMDTLKLAQYNVSKHVRELKIAGLVKEKKEGRYVFYSLIQPKSKFHENILKTLKSISQTNFNKDSERLKKRLKLRKNGKIIVSCLQNRKGCK
ncbi:MAG: metalloregulator ArsR/SmtB family transcription factor [Elusimicrobia bacterium]|nr:metalloregulator ArsR/SmtB family transcription factor [Elusimicrobiota bacterium]